jgi:DNA replication and repair protein RecF
VEIRKLTLENIRNYSELTIELSTGAHLFAGANAQGKTNLLEAVYLCATGRSARASFWQDAELITWGQDTARVMAEFYSERRGEFTVEIDLARKQETDKSMPAGGAVKKLKINDVERMPKDLSGLTPLVLFMVEDLEIVRGEPQNRRNFMDVDLGVMSKSYTAAAQQYKTNLDQRNRLLKELRDRDGNTDDLWAWSQGVATAGARILDIRLRFIRNISTLTRDIYQRLTNSTQEMVVEYVPGWTEADLNECNREDLHAILLLALEESVPEELRRGLTAAGPHRDDLRILVEGKDVRRYGSQGEGRTAALALRIAEFQLLTKMFEETPILMLDDILSELDGTRRAALLSAVASGGQTLLTTTDTDAYGLGDTDNVYKYEVINGSIIAR